MWGRGVARYALECRFRGHAEVLAKSKRPRTEQGDNIVWFRPKHLALVATSLAAVLAAPAAHAVVIDFEDVVTLLPQTQQTFSNPDIPAPQISQGFNFDWVEFDLITTILTHGHVSRAGKEVGDAWVWVASNDPADPSLSTSYLITDDSAFPIANNSLTISPVDLIPASNGGIVTSNDDTNDDDDDTGGGGTPPPTTGFSIQSFDVAEVFGPTKSAQTILVTGFLDDSDDIVDLTLPIVNLDEDFTADPTVALTTAFQTVLFGPEWTGLKRIVFDGGGSLDVTGGDYFAIDNIIVNEPDVVDPDDPDGAIGVPEPSSLAIFGFATIALGWAARRRDNAPATALVRMVKKCYT